MYKNSVKTFGERKCPSCKLTLNTEENFEYQPMKRCFTTSCKKCMKEQRTTFKRRTSMQKATNIAVHKSHQRMLKNALKQRVEVTDPSKLRDMYPEFTDLQITRMARLNHKINVANDFLIEEQHYYLNPSERPSGGIDYQAELFEERVFEDDKELSTIITEQIDIDDQ
jgi:hypothetical protein